LTDIKDLEIGRLFWITQVDPKCNYNYSYKMEEEREYNTEERKCDNFKRERKRFEVVIL
jgi:hypothetical protein